MLLQSPEPEAYDKVTQKSRPNWNLEILRRGETRSTRRKTSVDVATSGAQFSSGAHNVINDNEADFSSVSPFVLTFWRVTTRSDSTVIFLRWKFDPYQLFWYQLLKLFLNTSRMLAGQSEALHNWLLPGQFYRLTLNCRGNNKRQNKAKQSQKIKCREPGLWKPLSRYNKSFTLVSFPDALEIAMKNWIQQVNWHWWARWHQSIIM